MIEAASAFRETIGIGADTLTFWQMALRALIVYVLALVMVRAGEKRFLGKNTAFDVILGIILGSVVSRAVTGQSEFFPTLGTGFVLVLLHWLFAAIAFRWSGFGTLIKGSPRTLVEDGQIDWDQMRQSHISRDDLLSALRTQARLEDLSEVKTAYLERSGDISVLKKDSGPKVVEVSVKEGVQTVRIEVN